jgi:hypothetical protein
LGSASSSCFDTDTLFHVACFHGSTTRIGGHILPDSVVVGFSGLGYRRRAPEVNVTIVTFRLRTHDERPSKPGGAANPMSEQAGRKWGQKI